MNLPSLREHGTAIVEALAAELPGRIGDGETPPDVGWQGTPGASDFKGYGIVYSLGLELDGPIGDNANDDAGFIVQVTAVGANRAQAALIFDIVKDLLYARNFTIPGRRVNLVDLFDTAGGVRRDDITQPGLFIATPRFRITTTPS